jgi:demethylmenaquinone methyltransferase/2-methoxy-6-polyprenyl-1,4-benzoquinol methylase
MDAPSAKSRYNHTAWFYEPLAAIYSLGKIRASKMHELQYIRADDRVLYAGVGGGEDALQAARKGAMVTCVELSSSMLGKVSDKLERAAVTAELICGDVLRHERTGYYDVVCANYFLNVFKPEVMSQMLDHLLILLKPGGKLLVADFAVPRGNPLFQALHILYYRIANVTYWVLSRSDLHGIYDYAAILPRHGVLLETVVRHPLFWGGPTYFQTVVTHKPPAVA